MRRFFNLAAMLALAACSSAPRQHVSITNFTFPWSEKPAPHTRCDLSTTSKYLIAAFTVEDSDIVIADSWNGESTLNGEDRVELFFARNDDASLKNYWCLEIDPLGRVHDYHASHYRKFDPTWNCSGLQTTARHRAGDYEVTVRIPLSTMSDLLGHPITHGSEIRLGLYRAEFYGKSSASHGAANDNWLSWVRPDVSQPDFHVPSAFRLWKLP